MSKITYHTFYTNNIPNYIVDMHKEICKKFDIKVKYHCDNLPESSENDRFPGYRMHGEFMDHVMNTNEDDIVGFLDIDCLPLDRYNFFMPEEYVAVSKTFCGNAQNISHAKNRHCIYAAASHLLIHKLCWQSLGKPSLKYQFLKPKSESEDLIQIDTAMNLTLKASIVGYDYQLFLPLGYSMQPKYPIRLGPYGYYGVGTFYPASWHLLSISSSYEDEDVINLWNRVSTDILDEVKPSSLKYSFLPYKVFNFF